jgi:hypothetical protein
LLEEERLRNETNSVENAKLKEAIQRNETELSQARAAFKRTTNRSKGHLEEMMVAYKQAT